MCKTKSEQVIRNGVVASLLSLVALLSACSDEGRSRVGDALENISTTQPADDGSAPAPAEAAPEDPAPEEAPSETTALPEPEPEPTETGPTDPAPNDGDSSTQAWILLFVLGLTAIAIFIVAVSAGRRRTDARAEARAALHSRLSDVVGRSRWLHDSGSVEVLLTTDPDQLTRAWNEVRTRIVGLESLIATLAASIGDIDLNRDLRNLSRCVSDLRTAEEGYVTTRLRARGDHRELTRTSTQTITDRRQQLQAAIEPVAAALRI